jgi:acyl transferase domain-containing protein/SAM-dependent methyltransferase
VTEISGRDKLVKPAGAEDNAELSPVKRALQEIRELRSRLAAAERAAFAAQHDPIAIVGVGLRFPGGVVDAQSFWDLLAAGKDAITDIPQDRWDWRLYFNRNAEALGAMYCVRGGYLDGIDGFDADFFGLAPREAIMLDPQQRLLQEVAWHALEDAAIRPDRLRHSRTGIFTGLSNFDYYRAVLQDDLRIDAYAGSGNSPSMAAGRLAYMLGVHGPTMTVDTSCSSSLVAVHLACQSLRVRECNLALAGGVNVILAPQMHIGFSRAHMLAPDGRCKTFDEAADGYVRSEGCAVVVLKRLQDAIEEGDRILAVVRGSAVNHDGRSAGLTAPSSQAQSALLREAYRNADVALEEVGMIEAHGTGTSLGDPIEMEALGQVFGSRSPRLSAIAVGSVKTNLGHTEAASGMAGLLKAALSLHHQQIPRHLNLHKKSAFIPWQDLPFYVPANHVEWKLEADQRRRVAGVSSFGFSGSNAHVVLEEFVAQREDTGALLEEEPQVAVLSAGTEEALAAAQNALAQYLQSNGQHSLRDVCHTLSRSRMHHSCRRAYIVSTREELLQQLRSDSAWAAAGVRAHSPNSVLGFLFSGQGSEHTGMGLELLANSSIFRSEVDRMDRALEHWWSKSIRAIWANEEEEQERASLVQPALYAYGWALSELWRGWGAEPRVVLGHSLGEYVAATVAGVMTPEEGIRLVAARGRLTEQLAEPGAMTAVAASKEQIDALLVTMPFGNALSIAAVNGPESVVVSGRHNTVQQLEERLRSLQMRYKRLRITHGFHSSALDGMLDAFQAEAAAIEFRVPEVPWISNLTGKLVERNFPVDAQYWRQHLRETVEFSQGLIAAQTTDASAFLEIGPKPHLVALAEANGIAADRCVASAGKGVAMGEWHGMLTAASRLYEKGVELDWHAVAGHRPYLKLPLPGYPFQRKRFWFNDGLCRDEGRGATIAQAAADQASSIPIELPTARIAEGLNALNHWATALMRATLKDLGCLQSGDNTVTAEALIREHGVVPTHRMLMERWLRRLNSNGILISAEDGENSAYALAPGVSAAQPELIWAETEQLGDEPLRNYLANCAAGLLRVLRGDLNPLETLFPRGNDELARGLYERSPAAVYVNCIAAAAVAARARLEVKTSLGFPRRLRILEVGGGTGATSAAVLARLSSDQVLYTFSDVSEVFLARARQRFRAHAMEFTLFDLDSATCAEAHQGRYDVVLVANALHAAKDLRASLARLFDVLQPGGSLVLVETTADQAWHDVSTGLIEGWQHFSDEARSSGSPLISLDRWAEELACSGFEHFSAAPSPELATHRLGLHVLIAHKPVRASAPLAGRAGRSGPALESPISFAISERDLASLDGAVSPRHTSSGADISSDLLDEIASASPKQRTGLALEAVTTAVAQVLGRTELPMKDDRLMELGLDSLMALELQNRLQTIFGIHRLSSTLIFDYPTSEAIASFLLLQLGYQADGRDVDRHGHRTDASADEVTGAPIHSEDELNRMSDDEIAELLRMHLEQ